MRMVTNGVLIVGSTGPLSRLLNEYLTLNGFRVKIVGRSISNSDIVVDDDYLLPHNVVQTSDTVIFLAWPTSIRDWSTQMNFVQTTSAWAKNSVSVSARFIFLSTTQASGCARSRYGRAKRSAELEVLRLGGLVLRVGLVVDDSIECLATRIRKTQLTRLLPGSIKKLPIELTSSRDLCESVLHLASVSTSDIQELQCASKPVSILSLIAGKVVGTPSSSAKLRAIMSVLNRLSGPLRDHPLIDGLIGLGDRDASHMQELATFHNLSKRDWNEFCWTQIAAKQKY